MALSLSFVQWYNFSYSDEQRLNNVENNVDVQVEEGGANSKIQKENNGVAQSASEESEEELDDVSMDEDHDSEFVGGIWLPPGKQI